MASKENQEALEDVKSYLITDNDYVATITGEAVKTLQQAIDRLELVEKALEINCRDRAFCDIDQHSTQDFMNLYIAKARKELLNEKDEQTEWTNQRIRRI